MKSNLTTFILIMGLCSGCATSLSSNAKNIREADEKMVADCIFITSIQGNSGWGNLASGVGMQNSKNEILERAASQGATHVVFTGAQSGYTTSATGRAYKCTDTP